MTTRKPKVEEVQAEPIPVISVAWPPQGEATGWFTADKPFTCKWRVNGSMEETTISEGRVVRANAKHELVTKGFLRPATQQEINTRLSR